MKAMKLFPDTYRWIRTLHSLCLNYLVIIILNSCSLTEEISNNAPLCFITNPKNGDERLQQDSILISVEASDKDGLITEVIFSIDSIEVGSCQSPPYQYTWISTDSISGQHSIQATATDNSNNASSHSISIHILDNDSITWETAMVKDVDGNTYKTVKIGDQWWMAENLKTSHYANGTEIPLITGSESWASLEYTDKAFCYYDDSASNAQIYGALYNWAAAMNGAGSSELIPSQVQGACPTGWHLPSDGEWMELEMNLGMSYEEVWLVGWRGTNEGTKMKETTGWFENGNGTNSCGFAALPAGIRDDKGIFSDAGKIVHYWSTTEYFNFTTLAFNRKLSYKQSGIGFFHASHLYGYPKNFGFSVRCLKD
ncbi:MAG: FISUMP domain-containing protein [Bacteroidales bacterium]